MSEQVHEITAEWGVLLPPDRVVPLDVASGAVQPVTAVNAIVGISAFGFDFFNEGGTNNLLPGRPTTQRATFRAPDGAGAFLCLRSVLGAFVTDGGSKLTERPLGEFAVSVGFADRSTLSCTIMLSDSNSDDAVKVSVHGTIVFFR